MFFSENELSLELLGVFKIKRSETAIKSFDKRHYDSLSVRLEGRGQFKTEKETVTVKEGDVLYLPKNASYEQKTSGETVIAIHFINYSYDNKNKIETISTENYSYVIEIVKEMYEEWKAQKQGYRYKCVSLLYSLLHFLNYQAHSEYADVLAHNDKLEKAIDYIHSNFRSKRISISELASMCAVSETYFRRVFKRIYSVSPSQYVINLRLEYSSQLLSSRLYTISETSEKSGFCDAKYFSKLFKKRFGYTPKRYQNMQPEKIWK